MSSLHMPIPYSSTKKHPTISEAIPPDDLETLSMLESNTSSISVIESIVSKPSYTRSWSEKYSPNLSAFNSNSIVLFINNSFINLNSLYNIMIIMYF